MVPRAQRFQMDVRVLWRLRGGGDWAGATGVNASRSGLLFRCDQFLMVGTEIEFIFALSWDMAAPVEVADIICSGHVVRTESVGTGGESVLAATIESYEYIRGPKPAVPSRL